MGGAVAVMLAQQFPHLVSCMILSSPAFSYRYSPSTVELYCNKAVDTIGLRSRDHSAYDIPEIITSTHSQEKLLRWLNIQKTNPKLLVSTTSKEWLKAYDVATATILSSNSELDSIPTLILQAERDVTKIIEMQCKYADMHPASTFIRVYKECYWDILNEVQPVVLDIKKEIIRFVREGGALSRTEITINALETLTSERKAQVQKRSTSTSAIILSVFPKVQKLMSLADFRDKAFKIIQVSSLY